jgi:hypothetical protein
MADQNVIEILIKSVLEGSSSIKDLQKQLDLLGVSAEKLRDQFSPGLVEGIDEELKVIIADLAVMRAELVKTGKSTEELDKMEKAVVDIAAAIKTTTPQILTANQSVAQSYKASFAAADAFNKGASTSTAYRSSLEAARQYAVGASQANKATVEAASVFGALSLKTRALTSDKLGLRRALGFAVSGLTDLGPAGGIATNALLAIATGAGAMGVAIGLASTAIALLVNHFKEAKQKKEEFDTAMRTNNLGFFVQQVAEADRKLLEFGGRLDDIRRRQAEFVAGGVRGGDAFTGQLLQGVQGQEKELLAEREKAVAEQQRILGDRARQAGLSIEFQTHAINANVREQQELAHQSRIVNALQGEMKDASQKTKDEFIRTSEVLRDQATTNEIKNQTNAVKDQANAFIRSQAEVAASGKRLLAETTGNAAALQQAFAIERGAVIKASEAALAARLRDNKVPEAEAGIRANAAQEQSIQLAQIQLQQQRSLHQQKEQTRAIELAQLKAVETASEALLAIEQGKLGLLREQQAPANILEAQVERVREEEETLANVRITSLTAQRERLQLHTLTGNLLEQEKLKEQQITQELNKQVITLGLIQQRKGIGGELQDRKNRLVGLQAEIQVERELAEAAAQRDQTVTENKLQLLEQVKDLEREIAVAGETDEKKRRILEVNLAYERQRETIEALIQKFPELEAVGTQAFGKLAEANQATLRTIEQNSNALVRMAQSLSDVFVNSLDRAFDTLLDSSGDFGDKMQALFTDIGRTIVKSLLHQLITVPLKDALDTSIGQLKNFLVPAAGGTGQAATAANVVAGGTVGTGVAATGVAATGTATAAVDTAAITASFTAVAATADLLVASLSAAAAAADLLVGSLTAAATVDTAAIAAPIDTAAFTASLTAVSTAADLLLASLTAAAAAADLLAASGGAAALVTDTLALSLGAAAIGVDTVALSSGAAALTLDLTAISAGALTAALTAATAAATAFAAAAAAGSASSGGEAASGLISGAASAVGAFFGKGGIVIPQGMVRAFAKGGQVHSGPVLGMIGEEGPEIVARMKPARAQDMKDNERPSVQVIIEGDITPRRPDMKPEDVINIIVNNGNRTDSSGIGGMIKSVIKRNR